MFVLGGDDRRPCQHGLTQSGLEAGRPKENYSMVTVFTFTIYYLLDCFCNEIGR